MPLTILRGPDDLPVGPLHDRTIAVLGYGNQGHAHALNLRDSGLQVIVGNRAGSDNGRRAIADGFEPLPLDEATRRADLVIVALPDEVQPEQFRSCIEPAARPGSIIGFLHGFAIHYEMIDPRDDLGIVLVAPKGPGRTLRDRFVAGQGLLSLLAVHQDPGGDADRVARAWAAGIGSARAGVIRTTFAAETETDLFGEQAVLCGGLTGLIVAAFETLVEAGYPPELAYLECCHEVKQVADLVYRGGLTDMMAQISNTAEYGAYRAGPLVVDESVRATLRSLLDSIRDGSFARAMAADHAQGGSERADGRAALGAHPIEPAGRTIRELMPWL